ncbi:3-oxoadipate enol-lactonase [Streptomyces sp. NPDC059740]|uniref:bifunctional 3-oxoadipate enol-lactonase/4-carboxymuconolactone decarboxylase PcaDC n=1 Tax=Streptomyces sp. NPDC059740 TaxID=3346926 RepID=UPI00365C59A4
MTARPGPTAAPPASPGLHHRVDGPADAPALVLGPSLGTSLRVWDAQLPDLARSHRVVRWDLPGHGGSPAGLLAPQASVADLGRLVLDLADSLGLERFAYAGVSLGGAVGSWLALHHPRRLTSLAVLCSSAHFGEAPDWRERAARVRAQGTAHLADISRERWFTPAHRDTPQAQALAADLLAADPEGYAACCEALATFDVRADLADVTLPTLVLVGRQDPVTPPAHAREIADAVPDATLVEVPGAAHLAAVEAPAPVLAALRSHLAADSPATPAGAAPEDDTARRAAGTQVRRAVLGDAHVDRATAATSEFTAPFQDFITRYAWGEIWTRPGLSHTTRRCITLAALVARGHTDELRMHVRAALHGGMTAHEIREVLLQTAVYCGVPAANSAFAVADRVIEEEAR